MRLRVLRRDQVEPPGEEIWDNVANGRRGALDVSAGLPGPFNPLLYSPRIGRHVAALGEAVRYDGMLDEAMRELATLTVVVFWGAEFATQAHTRLARRAGLGEPCIDALLRGDPPPVEDRAALVTHRFVRAVVEQGHVPDGIYRDAVAALGEPGVVELTLLVGYYTLTAFTLNTFQVPAGGSDRVQ
jgi:4-carboxymuconolactone decarboxylase